jgi:hypothetical protein
MHAVPPEGPLHRDDRDTDSDWLEEPSTKSRVSHDRNRPTAAIPTLLLVAAVALIVAVILLL